MKSLVIFLVDNGDTIDPLNQFQDEASDLAFNVPDLKLIDWTVRVDIPNTDNDYTFRAFPDENLLMGLHSRDHAHVTFPGD